MARQRATDCHYRTTVASGVGFPQLKRNQNDPGAGRAGVYTQGQWLFEAPKVAPSA